MTGLPHNIAAPKISFLTQKQTHAKEFFPLRKLTVHLQPNMSNFFKKNNFSLYFHSYKRIKSDDAGDEYF